MDIQSLTKHEINLKQILATQLVTKICHAVPFKPCTHPKYFSYLKTNTHRTLKFQKPSGEFDYFQSHGGELSIFKLCERNRELIQQYNESCDTQLMMSGSH